MKARSTAIAIGFVLVFLQATQVIAQKRRKSRQRAASAATARYVFTSPDHDFTLTFPRKPNREADEEGVVTLIRKYAVDTEKGMRFDVNFQDVGGDPRAPQNNEWASYLEQMATDAARRRGERVVQIHRIGKNIVEMEIWQTVPENGANQNYLDRSILRQGRVYTLGCGSLINDKEVDRTLCRRFFKSMRFTR